MGHQLIKRVLMVFVSSLFLTACDEQPKTPDIFDGTDDVPVKHEHTYSDVWQSDSQFHWHLATCEHTTETKDNAPHQFDLVENIAPTYSSEGHKKYVCLVCQYVNEQTLDILTHTYSDEWTTNSQGHWHACLDEGFESSKADYSVHTFTTKVVDPTFETKGSITYTCSTCGYVMVEDIPMVEHEYDEEIWSSDETGHWHPCTDEGYEETEKKDFHTHSYNVSVKDPTFEEEGATTYTCVECGYTYYVETSIKEHSYSKSYSYDAANHWHQCVDVGYYNLKKDIEPHDYVEEQIEPTFETAGYLRKTCQTCGHVELEVNKGPLAHNFDTRWVNNSYYHWHFCIDEGYEELKSEYEQHNFIYDEVDPGPHTKGKITSTCVDCGYTFSEETPSLYELCDGKWTFDYNSYSHYYIFTGFTEDLTVGYIPDTYNDKPVRQIAANSLKNTNLEKLFIGNNVNYIHYNAFGSSSAHKSEYLRYISFGNSVSSVSICDPCIPNLKKVRCGTAMTDFGWVEYFENIETIEVDADNPNYCSSNGIVFTKDMTKVVRCGPGRSGTVLLPDGVTTIGANSFRECQKITWIRFENESSISKIERYAFFYAYEFKGFLSSLYKLETIEYYAFYYTALESFYLPKAVTYLPEYSFYLQYPHGYSFTLYYEGTESEYSSISMSYSVFYTTPSFVYLGDA